MTSKSPKISKKYTCNSCYYGCSKLSEWNKHLSTRKHKMITNDYQNDDSKLKKLYICICGKKYKHRQGLCVHRKQCTYTESKENQEISEMFVDPEKQILKEYNTNNIT